MVLMHDAYFYWTHRLMHHPRLFRIFHRAHHLSASPTPWAAYSFSVPEAFVQAGIGPLIVFTIPTHPLANALFMLWQVAFNVLSPLRPRDLPRPVHALLGGARPRVVDPARRAAKPERNLRRDAVGRQQLTQADGGGDLRATATPLGRRPLAGQSVPAARRALESRP
jgi:hypothetical protein